MLEHKGLIGIFSLEEEGGIYFGTVINTTVVITFQSNSLETIREEFILSVEDYLEFIKEEV